MQSKWISLFQEVEILDKFLSSIHTHTHNVITIFLPTFLKYNIKKRYK